LVLRAHALTAAIAFGIFLFYFAPYLIHHLRLPIGFDPPWYIWRAQVIASEGLGRGSLASRPGYPLLSVVIGALTRLPQIRLMIVLSLLLLPLFALTTGAFVRFGTGAGRTAWVLVVVTSAVVVGATDLAGENLATLLTITLCIAACALLAASAKGHANLWASVGLLVAAGLVHWDFLGLVGAVLMVAAILSWRSSGEAGKTGFRSPAPLRSRLLASAAVLGVGVTLAIVFLLRAPLNTVELPQSTSIWLWKFVFKLPPEAIPATAGICVAVLGSRISSQWTPEPSTRAIVEAWVIVMLAGVAVGLGTFTVPPSRFLDLLVAIPGGIGGGMAILSLTRLAERTIVPRTPRGRSALRIMVPSVLVSILIPFTVIRWYSYSPSITEARLAEARLADRYISTLPAARQVVFLVSYPDEPQWLAPKERAIRIALSPQHQSRSHIFVGELPDVLGGRMTPASDRYAGEVSAIYWRDVQKILPARPVVLILKEMATPQFQQAVEAGASIAGPGVAVVRGPEPPRFEPLSPLASGMSLPAAVGWAAAILLLLGVAGIWWVDALLGTGRDLPAKLGLAPTLGAGALLLGSFVAAVAGFRLSGGAGVCTYMGVALSGGLVWLWKRRLQDHRTG